ncbi:MAG: ABC transporter ATP-binding protein [Fusobacteriota bacterium]
MIEVKNLKKKFYDKKKGDFFAVDDVSFDVYEGEIFGLLGPNGAGKTTLLRMLSTIMEPTDGEATLNGNCIKDNPDGVKRSIGFLSGNTKLYKKLNPIEIMNFFGNLYDLDKKDLEERINMCLDMLNMHDFKDRTIEKLSTGQVQKVSIARCMIHDPDIYILDEPTLGLDILTSKTIIDFIRRKKEEGKTIIFSTHYMEEAELLCDKIGLIHKGKLIDSGSIEEMKERTGKENIRDIFFSYLENKDKKEMVKE